MALRRINYKKDLIALLKGYRGKFVTSYQLFSQLKTTNRALWDDLVANYASRRRKKVGAGAGRYYSPATFISLALDDYRRNGETSIQKEEFSSTDVVFEGVEPGYPAVVTIWAWKKPKRQKKDQD